MVKRREEPYTVSPWALTWDDENYYLIAYDEEADCIKHFRVDKMKSIEVLKQRRTGRDKFREFNLAKYAKMNFGMFGGDQKKVTLKFKNELVGVFIDRFGRDIRVTPTDQEGWSQIAVDIAVSDQFLGWIFALGTGVKITGPEDVVERFRNEISAMMMMYK